MADTKIGMKVDEEIKDIAALCESMQTVIKEQFAKGIDNIDTHEMYEAVDIFKDLCEAKKYVVEACYKKYILEAMEKSEEEDDEESEIKDEDVRFYRGRRRDSMGRFMSNRGRRSYHDDMMEREMYPMEYYRDMDRNKGIMYYDSNGQSGNQSRGQLSNQSGGQSGNASGSNSSTSSGNGTRSYSEGYNEGNSRGYEEGNRRGYDEGYNRGYSEGQSNGGSRRDYREGRSGQSRRGYIETRESHPENTPEAKQTKMRELEKYMNELSSDITEMISGASPEEKNVLKNKMQTLQQKIV